MHEFALYTLPLILLLSACGGGGGGGGGSLTNSITYTGSTSQALITQSNSEDLLNTALQQGRSSGSVGAIGVVQTGGETSSKPRALIVSELISGAMRKIVVDKASLDGSSATGAVSNGSISGPCGGSGVASISVSQSGSFSGTINFRNYCDGDAILNGSMTFTGVIDTSTDQLLSFNASFSALSADACGAHDTMSGTISMTLPNNPVVRMDIRVRDNNTSKVYWLNNFVLTTTLSVSYQDATMTGRFYDPDYGYVTLSTEVPLRYYDTDFWPVSGKLVATGRSAIANGSAKARLTAYSTSYLIEADTTGDGLYDYSITTSWPTSGCGI